MYSTLRNILHRGDKVLCKGHDLLGKVRALVILHRVGLRELQRIGLPALDFHHLSAGKHLPLNLLQVIGQLILGLQLRLLRLELAEFIAELHHLVIDHHQLGIAGQRDNHHQGHRQNGQDRPRNSPPGPLDQEGGTVFNHGMLRFLGLLFPFGFLFPKLLLFGAEPGAAIFRAPVPS